MSTRVANFCPDCGQQLGVGSKFCPKCRQPIDTASVSLDDMLFCPICQQEVMLDFPGATMCHCLVCKTMVDPVSKQYLIRRQQIANAQINTQRGGQDVMSTGSVGIGVPSEVRHWSWPAFWLMVPWLFAHGMTGWAVAMLVVIPLVLIPFIGILLAIADWVAFFYLCIHGNELAWKRGQFRDLNHFYARERKWIQAVWTTLIISVVVGFIIGSMSYMYYGGRAKMESLGPLPTVVYR